MKMIVLGNCGHWWPEEQPAGMQFTSPRVCMGKHPGALAQFVIRKSAQGLDEVEVAYVDPAFVNVELTDVVDGEIDWTLINDLRTKPHPLINHDPARFPEHGRCDSIGCGEIVGEARTAQHLLDLAGVPRGHGYSSDVDARTYLLVAEVGRLRERLDQISNWLRTEAAARHERAQTERLAWGHDSPNVAVAEALEALANDLARSLVADNW